MFNVRDTEQKWPWIGWRQIWETLVFTHLCISSLGRNMIFYHFFNGQDPYRETSEIFWTRVAGKTDSEFLLCSQSLGCRRLSIRHHLAIFGPSKSSWFWLDPGSFLWEFWSNKLSQNEPDFQPLPVVFQLATHPCVRHGLQLHAAVCDGCAGLGVEDGPWPQLLPFDPRQH